METTICFVRHAEPNYANHDDMSRELSSKGLEDRRLVTKFIQDRHVDVILSSPFKRAIDTVADLAEVKGLPIEVVDNFRERRVDSVWIEDFNTFCKNQWADFNYKLADGECLKEVQNRNIAALNNVLESCEGKSVVIGSHGTALSTIINYYDKTFGYEEFEKIRNLMPWVVEFSFENKKCVAIGKCDLFENMSTLDIYGANRFEKSTKIREACRGIVVSDDKILLTYEVNSDQWFIPGGGVEDNESLEEGCARELAEETGCAVEARRRYLTINEYYEEWHFISHYYICDCVGEANRKLTERETLAGLEPRWVPLQEAINIFSKHQDYAAEDEMKRGAYLREYEALLCFLKNVK